MPKAFAGVRARLSVAPADRGGEMTDRHDAAKVGDTDSRHIRKGPVMSIETIIIIVVIVLVVLFVLGYFGRGRLRR